MSDDSSMNSVFCIFFNIFNIFNILCYNMRLFGNKFLRSFSWLSICVLLKTNDHVCSKCLLCEMWKKLYCLKIWKIEKHRWSHLHFIKIYELLLLICERYGGMQSSDWSVVWLFPVWISEMKKGATATTTTPQNQ